MEACTLGIPGQAGGGAHQGPGKGRGRGLPFPLRGPAFAAKGCTAHEHYTVKQGGW